MTIAAGWLKPALQIKGQDPLGVRAPCENIYTQLLPGITNVTDRADLYAFYPWIIWAFEQHDGPLRKQPFFKTLRQGECLLTLIGIWHAYDKGQELWAHGGGLVGRDKLGPALAEMQQGKSIRLSTYASIEDGNAQRYFKNQLGGLGQYYLGSLRDLGIIHGDVREIKYVTERGGLLAEAFDRKVDRKQFFATLERDRISLDDLKQLRRFCPCYMNSNPRKQEELVDLFFNRPGKFYEPLSNNRRDTLTLMLDLAAKLESPKELVLAEGFDVQTFRACTYTNALPSGESWNPPDRLSPVFEGWRIYGLNELLSIAIQSFFWSGLSQLAGEDFLPANSEEYQQWYLATFNARTLGLDLDEPFEAALERTRRTMPLLSAWVDDRHEIQLGRRLAEIRDSFNNDPFRVVRAALTLLVQLGARSGSSTTAYAGFVPHHNYLSYYPINLDSFHFNVRQSWKTFTVRELIGWIAKDWGINAHFRVALRKLRFESRDTFKIKPTDQGLAVIDPPIPVFSNPRLVQATQILMDVGAFEPSSDHLIVSSRGRQLLTESAK